MRVVKRITVPAVAAATLVAGSATASYLGKNGRIAFAAGCTLSQQEICPIEASGSGVEKLASSSVAGWIVRA